MANLTVLQDGSERIHYSNPFIPIYVCRGNLRGLSGMAALCHWHEEVEFLLPYKGHLYYNINGARLLIPQGDAVFVNSRNLHYGFSDGGTDCEYICVAFRPQLLCSCEGFRQQYVLPVVTHTSLSHALLDHGDSELAGAFGALWRLDALYREKPKGYEMAAMGALYQLWPAIYSLAKSRGGRTGTADGKLDTLRRMLDFIRTHYAERITLNQIAAAGGVCRSSCCQIFRENLHQTPNDYLNSFRVEQGMALLRSTALPVTEISALCGFNSPSYFAEMFLKQKGCTPSTYRKNL